MKYTVVMPFAYEPYKNECLSTCKFDPENLLLVDNTVENKGIMRSHNMGIEKMFQDDSEWLIILSAAIRFGKWGGLDFIDALEHMSEHLVVEASGVYGWHLIAFNRRTIKEVGKWDENFTPYGYDDLDISWRIQKAFGLQLRSQLWEKVFVAVGDMGMNHGLTKSKTILSEEHTTFLRNYYMDKWGVEPESDHEKAWSFPFGDITLPLSYWPTAKNGGSCEFKV